MTALPTEFEGYIIDLLDELASNATLHFAITPVDDGKYGSRENGDWNGMIGELSRDVCVSFLTLS